ncbi:MAG: hypothetical protein K6E13_06765 [Lachnospiraceae bacterium]|nr:hypothetical protein [Lachnospiraceae bacterium]
MTDQNTFMETLHEVSEIIRTAPEPMTEEEILKYFKDMELTPEQEAMVIEYLSTPHEEEMPDETEDEAEESAEDEVEEVSKDLNGQDDDTVKLPNTPVFEMYMEEIKALPKYAKKEIDGMYEKLLSGDESVVEKLSGIWLEKVLEAAVRFGSVKTATEDVIQEGNIGLYLALKSLVGQKDEKNPKKVIESQIEDAIKAYVSEATGEVDEESTILGKVTLVYEAEKLLAEELGRTPDISELADYTKLEVSEIEDIKNVVKEKTKEQ